MTVKHENPSRAIVLAAVSLALVGMACGTTLPRVEAPEQRTLVETEAVAPAPPRAVVVAPPPPTPTLLPDEWVVEADAEERLLANVYQRVNPSVLRIDIIGSAHGTTTLLGSGSGFIYDQEGHIVTNNHVIADADRALVTFSDGTVAEAEILAGDSYSDLAVIRVNVSPEALVPAELGDSDAIEV